MDRVSLPPDLRRWGRRVAVSAVVAASAAGPGAATALAGGGGGTGYAQTQAQNHSLIARGQLEESRGGTLQSVGIAEMRAGAAAQGRADLRAGGILVTKGGQDINRGESGLPSQSQRQASGPTTVNYVGQNVYRPRDHQSTEELLAAKAWELALVSILGALGMTGLVLHHRRQKDQPLNPARKMSGGGVRSNRGGADTSSKVAALQVERPTVRYSDVAGIDGSKEQLEEISQILREAEKFAKLGVRIPRGILLYGPPGTGKTLLAKAVAGETGKRFYHCPGSGFVEMFVGVGASRVRDLFRQPRDDLRRLAGEYAEEKLGKPARTVSRRRRAAQKLARAEAIKALESEYFAANPAFVFIDELDAAGKKRGEGLNSNDEREATLNQILVEMDGFDPHGPIVITIAATNRLDVLDPALLRPGRFDRKVPVEKPDLDGRHKIFVVHAKNRPCTEDIDFNRAAYLSWGMTGAEIANVMNEAAITAGKTGATEITNDHVEDAIFTELIGKGGSAAKSEWERRTIAYHEAGHAVLAYATAANDPKLISCTSRGPAGGFMVNASTEQTMLHTKIELEGQLRCAIAGRMAEERLNGRDWVTTGAANDLQQITKLAKAMASEFAMSDALGEMHFPEAGATGFGPGIAPERVDQAVEQIIAQMAPDARGLVKKYWPAITAIAERVLVTEKMETAEIEQFMEDYGVVHFHREAKLVESVSRSKAAAKQVLAEAKGNDSPPGADRTVG